MSASWAVGAQPRHKVPDDGVHRVLQPCNKRAGLPARLFV